MENEILDDSFSQDNYIGKQKVEILSTNKFIVLYFFSLGLYGTWWMYKTWKFFQIKETADIMPVARAIFAIIFMYPLFEKIQKYAIETGHRDNYSSVFLFILFLILNALSKLPDPFWLISMIGFISFLPPLKSFNAYLRNSEDIHAVESGYNTRQIVLIVIGALLWILVLIGTFIPDDI